MYIDTCTTVFSLDQNFNLFHRNIICSITPLISLTNKHLSHLPDTFQGSGVIRQKFQELFLANIL